MSCRKLVTEGNFQESLTNQINEKHLKTIEELKNKISDLEKLVICRYA